MFLYQISLESRCLTEDMDCEWRADIPPILPETFWDEALNIRNRLLRCRFDKYARIQLRPERVSESMEPRLTQVTLPLASIIEDKAMLEDLANFVARYNKELMVERRALLWMQRCSRRLSICPGREKSTLQ